MPALISVVAASSAAASAVFWEEVSRVWSALECASAGAKPNCSLGTLSNAVSISPTAWYVSSLTVLTMSSRSVCSASALSQCSKTPAQTHQGRIAEMLCQQRRLDLVARRHCVLSRSCLDVGSSAVPHIKRPKTSKSKTVADHFLVWSSLLLTSIFPRPSLMHATLEFPFQYFYWIRHIQACRSNWLITFSSFMSACIP